MDPDPGPEERDYLRYIPPQSERWDGHLSRLRRMEPAPALPQRPRGLPPLGVRQWQPPDPELLREALKGLMEL